MTSSESSEQPQVRRRKFLQTTAGIVPLKPAFLDGWWGSDYDFAVMNNGDVLAEDPAEIDFTGSVVQSVSEDDGTASVTLAARDLPQVQSNGNVYAGLTESEATDLFGTNLSDVNGAVAQAKEGSFTNYAAAVYDHTAATAQYILHKARGTIDSPEAVQDGDYLGAYRAAAYGGDGDFHTAADVFVKAKTPTGNNNQIIPSVLSLRTRDSNDSLISGLRVTENHHAETPNGTLKHNRVTVSSNTTASGDGYYSVDTSGGAVTLTLASADAMDGIEINVKRNGANSVTIDTEGSETVDDSTSISLGTDNDSATLVYNADTSDWEVF